MTTVAAIQSNYIPWKGYFDIIKDVDLFVFYDDLQYTSRDWRNRNMIKTSQGCSWLTIPVGEKRSRLINEVQITDRKWQKKHWTSIERAYSKTPYFKHYKPFFEEIYLNTQWTNLSDFNQSVIKKISSELLGIDTEFKDSRAFDLTGQKLERLLDLIVKSRATRYISGPAAKDYIDDARFEGLGIELTFKDYGGYPEYEQRFPPFEHGVTILDLLFNCGPSSPEYIWGWRSK